MGCMSRLTLRQAPPGRCPPQRGTWQSPATVPRRWLAAGFAVSAVFAGVAGARDPGRWTLLVASSPVIALALTVGGSDVPVLALLCLGLALLWRIAPASRFGYFMYPAGMAAWLFAAGSAAEHRGRVRPGERGRVLADVRAGADAAEVPGQAAHRGAAGLAAEQPGEVGAENEFHRAR